MIGSSDAGCTTRAADEPSVKRFVQTSSSSAAVFGRLNEVYDLTAETWNTSAVAESEKPGPYGPDRMVSTYAASKVKQEQLVWEFVKSQKPSFVANAVLPDFNVGKILNVEKQGYPSSVGFIKAAFEGNMQLASVLGPQYEVDVQDCARLHVAALLHPDIQNERVFAYAFPKTWTNTLQLFRELYPDRTFADPPVDEAEDKSIVIGRPRAEELLKWLGRDGFTSYKDSIKAVTDTLI